MKDAVYKISLDIYEHGSQAVLKAKKTDTGRKLHITLRAGGAQYIIEDDCYAVFKATKQDGSILYNACTIENNVIVYEFTKQTCTAVGRCRCEIALYGLDDKLITSPRFALLVDGTIYPDGSVESSSEFSALTHLVTDSMEAIENATNAAGNATQAAEAATGAAASASTESVRANEAAGSATAAAQEANTAAGSANQAAAAATQASQNASQSTENANTAAARANESAETANSASSNANQAATKAAQTAKSLMVVGKAWGTAIHLDDAINQFLVSCRVFGKTTQDGTPAPDAPVELVSVGDNENVVVGIYGKNLLQGNQKAVGEAFVHGGISFVRNADNSITMNGTATESAFYGLDYLGVETRYPTNTDLIASVSGLVNGVVMNIGYFDAEDTVFDSVVSLRVNALSATYQLPKEAFRGRTYITVAKGTTLANVVIYPMIRLATVKDPAYEKYKAQTMTIATPNGLPGIPVTSGGNYTDASGQQWICDEVDLARGVHIQRISKKEFDGSEVWSQAGDGEYFSIAYSYIGNTSGGKSWCSHFVYEINSGINYFVSGTVGFAFFHDLDSVSDWKAFLADQFTKGSPVTLIFPVATPIETPLSEEELAAYAALYTHKDNTTVSNDAGAFMELEYVMDAKKYIDSMLSGGSIIQATVE